MGGHFAAQALAIAAGRKYAHSAASKKISEASPVPREGPEAFGRIRWKKLCGILRAELKPHKLLGSCKGIVR